MTDSNSNVIQQNKTAKNTLQIMIKRNITRKPIS